MLDRRRGFSFRLFRNRFYHFHYVHSAALSIYMLCGLEPGGCGEGEQGNNPNLETGPPTPPAPPPNQPIVMIVIHRLFADDKKIIVSLTERHILHQLDELSDLGHRT